MTLQTVLILGGVFAFASFVQGLTGFAFALICVPALSLIFSPKEAVGIVAALGPVIVIYNFLLHRKEVEYRRVYPLALFSLIFLPVGAFFLYTVPESAAMVSLGVVVILLTLSSVLFSEKSSAVLGTRAAGYGFAALSGILGGAFSAPSVAIVTYFYTSDRSRMRAKSNVQFFFASISLAILLTHLVGGTVNKTAVLRALPFVPVIFLFTRLGAVLSRRLPVRFFRLLTDASLVALGAYLVVTHV